MAGRTTKRTPEVEKKILEVIAAGNFYVTACRYVGITDDTFTAWMKKYPDFSEAVKAAEARAEIRSVTHWQKAIPDNWAAARDFLARRHPDRWGNKERMTHAGDPNNPVTVKHEVDIDALRAAEQAYLDAKRN